MAAGHFQLSGTLKRTLTEGKLRHKTTEVKGTWREQASELADIANRFAYTAQVEHQLPADHVHLCCENYLADPRRIGQGATNLDPVWIGARLDGLLGDHWLEIVWQTPAHAKGFATDERLRLWDLWVRGSAHLRDANRHMALRCNTILG